MSDIFTSSSVYQGTFVTGTVQVDPVYQICAVANIKASNQLECSFWIHRNGERVVSDLGVASYLILDNGGAAIGGLSESNISPDLNSYYRITPVSAASLVDLTHYVLEISIVVGQDTISGSIGMAIGE